jgi:hypothetical protein
MLYVAFFQFESSVPSWSKQHPGLPLEVDIECQDCHLMIFVGINLSLALTPPLEDTVLQRLPAFIVKVCIFNYPNRKLVGCSTIVSLTIQM